MRKSYALIGFVIATALGGCADTGFDVAIDGEDQDFESVGVAITEAGSEYHLVATGTLADGSGAILTVALDAAEVKALEAGAELAVDGVANITGPGTDTVSYDAAGTQDAPVRRAWLSWSCDGCEPGGDLQQDVRGTLTLSEIAEDHLVGSLTLTIEGAIPYWRQPQDATAEVRVEFDADIAR